MKTGPAVKNKVHKLVKDMITWEKTTAEIGMVSMKRQTYFSP